MRKLQVSVLLLTIFTLVVFDQAAEAAKIQSVKGKRVVVDVESDSLKTGQIMQIRNSSGKVTGLVKILKVQGQTANGVIKGKAAPGSTLRPRPARKGRTAGRRASPAKTSVTKDQWMVGFMLGFNSASSETKLEAAGVSQVVELDGTGFSAKAFLDYPLFSIFKLRGYAGLEQFTVGGEQNALCTGGGECNVEINYLTADIWGRAVFGSGNFKPWAGAGLDVMLPISKKATAFNEGSITTTTLFAIGGGVDWYLSDRSYIPIQLEYDFYPSNENVKASAMAVRAGYAWAW